MTEVIPCVTMQRIPSGTPLRGCICHSGWSQGCVPYPGLVSGTPIRGCKTRPRIYLKGYIWMWTRTCSHPRMGVPDISPGQGTQPWDHPEWHMHPRSGVPEGIGHIQNLLRLRSNGSFAIASWCPLKFCPIPIWLLFIRLLILNSLCSIVKG